MSAGETRPHEISGQTQPSPAGLTRPVPSGTTRPQGGREAPRPPKLGWWPWLILAGLLALGVLGLSAVTGYMAGGQERGDQKATEQAGLLQEQFDLGVADLQAGRLEIAQQRFEYILQVDPNYPSVHDLLDLVLRGQNKPTSTPLPPPTEVIPTATPTLSVQSLDGLYAAAQTAVSQQNWDLAIEVLLSLRRKDPQYELAQVNQLFFGALRNRGLAEILNGEQEQGIFDLTLASRFGQLDGQAASWQRTAEFYLYANSFFGLDWPQAVANFSSLCAAGVWDSCFKYAESAAGYGDLLISQDKDYCGAVDQYEASLVTRDKPALYPTATEAFKACQTATAGPPTATPSPTGGTPTLELFTPTPSATPAPGATSTDTPTASATSTLGATSTFTPTVGATDTFTPTWTFTPTP